MEEFLPNSFKYFVKIATVVSILELQFLKLMGHIMYVLFYIYRYLHIYLIKCYIDFHLLDNDKATNSPFRFITTLLSS